MAGFFESEIACNGSMTVDGFPMNCAAWDIINFAPLWAGFEVRGENLVLPRLIGSRGFPRRLAETSYSLVLWVRGDADKDGVAHAENWQGLWENLEELFLNVTGPVDSGDGTRPCVLTLPNGVTQLTADCQFNLQEGSEILDPIQAIYTLEVTIPAGRFEPAGS